MHEAAAHAAVVAADQNIENNPMQSSLVASPNALSDPSKTFDTSGKSPALVHPHAIRQMPMARRDNGRFGAMSSNPCSQFRLHRRATANDRQREAEPRALSDARARGGFDVNAVPDLDRARAMAVTGRIRPAARWAH
jgi:hypothetical protein